MIKPVSFFWLCWSTRLEKRNLLTSRNLASDDSAHGWLMVACRYPLYNCDEDEEPRMKTNRMQGGDEEMGWEMMGINLGI